jgi:hypothetical protein
MAQGPDIKRLVSLVDRGPEDDLFFPASSNQTIFRRDWPSYHNIVPEVAEVAYQGAAAWGQRITIPLTRKNSGDLLQWLCVRLQPRSWLGADLESKVLSGAWDYLDASGAWMWAASLGSIAIQTVRFQVGDAVVEEWSGEWMDLWSRMMMDGGRAPVWDSDIYGQIPSAVIHQVDRPTWTTVLPTEDGYVYCWLPLTFLRRSQTAFPLVAIGEQQELRVEITFRPFADVVRRRARPRSSASEVPLGESLIMIDKSGLTPIPHVFALPTQAPGFGDVTVFAGVAQLEDPLRSAYMRIPIEMLYEPVQHQVYDVTDSTTVGLNGVSMQIPLLGFNGPIKELCWFLRRKAVWGYNEWTNYGSLLEDALVATLPVNLFPPSNSTPIVAQAPLLKWARLVVDNAIWREDSEQWWRYDYALRHRGGVRLSSGMVYGLVFGDAAGLTASTMQPMGTVNASRVSLRLDLTVQPPSEAPSSCGLAGTSWEVHVFAIGYNWMRFVNGMAGPLFQD